MEAPERPIYPLRDLVLFPGQCEDVNDARPVALAALAAATASGEPVVALAQVSPFLDDPVSADFFEYGTLARLAAAPPDIPGLGAVRLQGLTRVRVRRVSRRGDGLFGRAEAFDSRGPRPDAPLLEEVATLARRARERIPRLFPRDYRLPPDQNDAEAWLDGLAAVLSDEYARVPVKMKLLDKQDPSDRARVLKFFLLGLLRPGADRL